MNYYKTKCNLTKHQIEKLASALKHDTEVTLRISRSESGAHSLPLTKSQLNKLMNGLDHDITLSKTQINNIKKSHPDLKRGGLLPLIALIPLIASVLGGIGGLTGGIASAVSSSKANNEAARHNREVEEQLKKGSGYDKIIPQYNKMVKKGYSKDEILNTLHQKFGSGPVSDFLSKIPILGRFLTPITSMIGLGLKTKGKGLYLKSGKGLRL